MQDDVNVYKSLDLMLPAQVPRELSESALRAGEPESAISGLLDEAFGVGALTQEVIDFVESVYSDGPVIEMLEALKQLQRDSAA
ncbi:hypothetical protein NQ015_07705 [Corynebacterium sp. 153RC1]|uniref:hypothetical protein n=1 Tax=unclassified Corynebacterium TaxID=2624378 RepID=UPI00211C7DA3|nr:MULTISPECIES: hypothetical protein [unclassified Corynebacterium]MCQ9353447.1 hypothetical protein [Corynebacterium sp. 209RC1]MCQ9355117.1 hypothetical protein [Corynebacterium sp. 1222RC1]MCQ9357479.1 hypothetical protein [Corynebacterium sp. 122RC1]MCQ9359858.1 hypothetical protein [Corynebacterium sp. 142RC1]MCQ9361650.1 hypothetical protein [Corynebacterium sp. 153RC1]